MGVPLNAREFGSGGMGEVVELTDFDGPPSVAKFIRPEYSSHRVIRARFDTECQSLLTVSGEPEFAAVREIRRDAQLAIAGGWRGRTEGVDTLLIMENCGPSTLRDRINNRGSMNSGETAKTAAQLALGLYKIHLLGMVHRDFKHDNIAFDHDGGGASRFWILA